MPNEPICTSWLYLLYSPVRVSPFYMPAPNSCAAKWVSKTLTISQTVLMPLTGTLKLLITMCLIMCNNSSACVKHILVRMQTTMQIQRNLSFLPSSPGIIGYRINGSALNDKWKDIQVWFNGNATEHTLSAEWTAGYKTAVLNNEFVTAASGGQPVIKGYSCVILYRD